MLRYAFLVSCVLVLGACQTLSGKGPIVFSESTAALYQHYLSQDYPAKFAVSEDGRHSRYFYCPWNAVNCQGTPDTEVIQKCEEGSNGVPCLMFAKGRQVVWDGPGDFLRNHVQGEVRLDGSEPVLYGRSIQAFKVYKAGKSTGTFRAFAVNYRLSTKKLIAFGYSVRKATRDEAEAAALQECRNLSNGREPHNCKLYMVDDEKVWFSQN